jgi:hypothetical protein
MHTVVPTSYEPFVRDLRRIDAPDEWFIERVPSDSRLGAEIERWKTMVACGWDVTALVAGDSKTVVALGCRGAA